ncbi:hypothetical protein [Chryseobacterium taiwanense]|uniref:Uncharacterized protein n=1 Tax=Chryseobacterium taiwanense TaxID=363331 RepID=A0A0B4DHH4_9FLAO|nr:hypothetical protein [Chryseobacterium taiwanense]KIC63890.1 hypothetical protein RM51_03920 [Chryseobacterium taiwanense]
MNFGSQNFEKKRLYYGILNLIFFILILITPEYREYFGVIKGYAPYEFGFNIEFFFPCMFILLIITIVIFWKTIEENKKYQNKTFFILTIAVTAPILILWIFFGVKIIFEIFNEY